jgi:mannan endo-1,4-beta-mannosidase
MKTRHLIVATVICALAVVEFAVTRDVSLDGGPTLLAAPAPGAVRPAKSTPPPMYDVAHLLTPQKKYFGVAQPGDPMSPTAIQTWTAEVGQAPNILSMFESFDDQFAASQVRSAYQQGALPLLRWEPYQASMADIAKGRYDDYIATFATAARVLNLPVAMTFAHEMNGGWYPWGTKTTTAADYVAAWRHTHDLFVRAGAGNIIWIWTPNVTNPVPSVKLAPLYPGDAYVDLVGIDGYYTHRGAHTFKGLFGPTFTQVRTFTQRPFLIVETGAEPGSERAGWIKDLMTGVAADDQVLGVVWFNINGSAKWNIDRDASATAAFRRATADQRFGFVVR